MGATTHRGARLPVLVGVDGSSANVAALEWAAAEAADAGVELVLLHAVGDDPLPPACAVGLAHLEAAGRAVLDRARRAVQRSRPGVPVRLEVSTARSTETLARAAGAARMVVVGRRGAGGFPGLSLGSTSAGVAACALGSVVVVPPAPPGTSEAGTVTVPGTGRPVLVGLDPFRPETTALAMAFARAEQHGLPVSVLSAWHVPPVLAFDGESIRQVWQRHEERVAHEVQRALRPWVLRHPRVPVRTDVHHGHAAGAVLEALPGVDLAFLGRGKPVTGRPPTLGPVTSSVLQHADRPVAVVGP